MPAKIAKAKRGKINKFNLVVQCVSFCFQEFCFFAMVCLLSDFFLQMVLFVTVLSIDIRRMEVKKMHCVPTFIRLIYTYTPPPKKKFGIFFFRMEVKKMHCVPTFIRLIYTYTPPPQKKFGIFFQI